jgi:class 3 adenylate cyclase
MRHPFIFAPPAMLLPISKESRKLGCRTVAALAAHDAVLLRVIEAHDGWAFKHTGDGVCAAFASPRSAVDAAVAAKSSLPHRVSGSCADGVT